MKKIMVMVLIVMSFVMGVCGRNIVNEVKRQNDERFVQTKFYADELMESAPHKPMEGLRNVEYVLDWDNGIYARGMGEGKNLVFTVYKEKDEIAKFTFTREYRASDDQSKVYIQRNDDPDKVCVTYTGQLLENVVRTELKNVL